MRRRAAAAGATPPQIAVEGLAEVLVLVDKRAAHRSLPATEPVFHGSRAERLLADRQRALEQRPRAGEIALGPKQAGEVVEAQRRIRVFGAERLLSDRQRALEERPRGGRSGNTATIGSTTSRRLPASASSSLHSVAEAVAGSPSRYVSAAPRARRAQQHGIARLPLRRHPSVRSAPSFRPDLRASPPRSRMGPSSGHRASGATRP